MRKHFLDWLRVAAFGVLILYHVGMLYVTWDYNIKSDRQYPALEFPMSAVSAWRMVLLFFIAGVASRFLAGRIGSGRFAAARVRRLFIVVLLGMVVINPVQVYVEFLRKGWIEPGYLDFWWHAYLQGRPFPNRSLPTWDHLWFLLYLLSYSLLFAVSFKLIRRSQSRPPLWCLVALPGAWLCVTNVLIQEVRPDTWALFDDWANHLRWGGVFAAGVLCATRGDFWELVRRFRRRLLMIAGSGLALQIANGIHWRSGHADPAWDGVIYGVIDGAYGWVAALTIVGYAAEHLDRDSRLLGYLTDAALPIYVVHQPVLLVAAYLLLPLSFPVLVEVFLIIAITGLGSLLIHELLVRRWRLTRFLFGLRRQPLIGCTSPR